MSITLTWMRRNDMPAVLAIEQDSFQFPWTENEFLMMLRHRNCIGLVARLHDEIQGFALYELQRHSFELFNLAVDPKCRRFGIGSFIVSKLIGKLTTTRRRSITAVVRESNLPAQLFFRAVGFRAVEVLRGHYVQHSAEDGYRMEYRVPMDDLIEVPQ